MLFQVLSYLFAGLVGGWTVLVGLYLFLKHHPGRATATTTSPTEILVADTVIGPLEPIEIVIARDVDSWEDAPAQAMMLYAQALVIGTVAPVTATNQWTTVAAAVGYDVDQRFDNGVLRWQLDEDAWRVGICTLHGLSKGVIETAKQNAPYGARGPLTMAWTLHLDSLEGTGLTTADVETAFGGDLLATAHAVTRAYAYICPVHRQPCAEHTEPGSDTATR